LPADDARILQWLLSRRNARRQVHRPAARRFYFDQCKSCNPVIRFTNESANSLVAYLVLLLPAPSVVFSIKIPKSDFSKALLPLSVLPIACLVTFIGVLGMILVGRTPIQRVEMNGYMIQNK
jgi:hypothetical protein